jgi:hypothetical protein
MKNFKNKLITTICIVGMFFLISANVFGLAVSTHIPSEAELIFEDKSVKELFVALALVEKNEKGLLIYKRKDFIIPLNKLFKKYKEPLNKEVLKIFLIKMFVILDNKNLTEKVFISHLTIMLSFFNKMEEALKVSVDIKDVIDKVVEKLWDNVYFNKYRDGKTYLLAVLEKTLKIACDVNNIECAKASLEGSLQILEKERSQYKEQQAVFVVCKRMLRTFIKYKGLKEEDQDELIERLKTIAKTIKSEKEKGNEYFKNVEETLLELIISVVSNREINKEFEGKLRELLGNFDSDKIQEIVGALGLIEKFPEDEENNNNREFRYKEFRRSRPRSRPRLRLRSRSRYIQGVGSITNEEYLLQHMLYNLLSSPSSFSPLESPKESREKSGIKATSGSGLNCFFHAVFGEEKEGVVYSKDAATKRKEFCNWLEGHNTIGAIPLDVFPGWEDDEVGILQAGGSGGQEKFSVIDSIVTLLRSAINNPEGDSFLGFLSENREIKAHIKQAKKSEEEAGIEFKKQKQKMRNNIFDKITKASGDEEINEKRKQMLLIIVKDLVNAKREKDLPDILRRNALVRKVLRQRLGFEVSDADISDEQIIRKIDDNIQEVIDAFTGDNLIKFQEQVTLIFTEEMMVNHKIFRIAEIDKRYTDIGQLQKAVEQIKNILEGKSQGDREKRKSILENIVEKIINYKIEQDRKFDRNLLLRRNALRERLGFGVSDRDISIAEIKRKIEEDTQSVLGAFAGDDPVKYKLEEDYLTFLSRQDKEDLEPGLIISNLDELITISGINREEYDKSLTDKDIDFMDEFIKTKPIYLRKYVEAVSGGYFINADTEARILAHLNNVQVHIWKKEYGQLKKHFIFNKMATDIRQIYLGGGEYSGGHYEQIDASA